MTARTDIAWSYFEAQNEGRTEDALVILDDAGSFWNLRSRVVVPTPDMKAKIRGLKGSLPITFTRHRTFADGDHVIFEAESHCALSDGYVYRNLYVFVIEMVGEKILHVREYQDVRVTDELMTHLPN